MKENQTAALDSVSRRAPHVLEDLEPGLTEVTIERGNQQLARAYEIGTPREFVFAVSVAREVWQRMITARLYVPELARKTGLSRQLLSNRLDFGHPQFKPLTVGEIALIAAALEIPAWELLVWGSGARRAYIAGLAADIWHNRQAA